MNLNVKEQETSASVLSPLHDIEYLTQRWAEFAAEQWDDEIEADAEAGRLDEFMDEALRDFENGRCKPL